MTKPTTMVNIKGIEKAVCEYYKVNRTTLYKRSENTYPTNGARSVFMYLLYKDRMKIYEIQDLFGYNARRAVEYRIASVASSVKKNKGKFAEDIEKINQFMIENNLVN